MTLIGKILHTYEIIKKKEHTFIVKIYECGVIVESCCRLPPTIALYLKPFFFPLKK